MALELPEGSGRAKLRGILSALGERSRRDIHIELATVNSPLPNIRVKVDNMAVELDAEDIVVCEHLTQHTRTATIDGGAPVDIVYEAALAAGDRVIVASINDGQSYVIIDRIGGG